MVMLVLSIFPCVYFFECNKRNLIFYLVSTLAQSLSQPGSGHRTWPNVDRVLCEVWKARPHVVHNSAFKHNAFSHFHFRFRLLPATGTWAQFAAANQRSLTQRGRLSPVRQPPALATPPGRPAVHQQERNVGAPLHGGHHGTGSR